MKVLNASIGEYKTVHGLHLNIDLTAVTVLFGPNGAGKTNILEAIAEMLEYAIDPAGLGRGISASRRPEEDGYPGSLVLEFDRWREEGHADQDIVWKLLTNRETADAFILGDWEALPVDLRERLELACSLYPSPCPSTATLADLMDAWAAGLASTSTAGSAHDRMAVAREVIRQAIFDMPHGRPMVIPDRLPRPVRDAAARVVAAPSAAAICPRRLPDA